MEGGEPENWDTSVVASDNTTSQSILEGQDEPCHVKEGASKLHNRDFLNAFERDMLDNSMPVEPYRDDVDGISSPEMMEIDVNDKFNPNDEILDVRLHSKHRRNRKVYIAIGVCSFVFVLGLLIGSGRGGSTTFSETATSPALTGRVTFIPPPDDLGTICDNLDTKDRRDACEAACAPSECCQRPAHLSPHISCLKGHHDECHTYHMHCIVLHEHHKEVTGPVSIPPPPHNIKEMCSPRSIEFHSGQATCQEICEPAECCYEDFDKINATFASEKVCKHYSTCHHLKGVKDLHHDIGYLVNEKCDAESDTYDRNSCKDVCNPAQCCFDPLVKCPGEHEHGDDYCEQYDACKTIVQLEAPSDPSEEIPSKCTEHNLEHDLDKMKHDHHDHHHNDHYHHHL